MTKTLVILSGGMDSAALLFSLRQESEVEAISFDYGQRHKIELTCAARLAELAGAPHHLVDLTAVGQAIAGTSALLAGDRDIPVPHGHYAADNMAITVVPNRNSIMANIAAGVAWARGCQQIALGVHRGDWAQYPDCTPQFVNALRDLLRIATEGRVGVIAPFVELTKTEIVTLGEAAGTPWAETHSCYEGERLACGRCGTCTERLEAFELAGVEDPLQYAPGGREYAKRVTSVSSDWVVPKYVQDLPLFRQ